MESPIVRHISLLIIPQQIEIPDYFFAFYPALKHYMHSREQTADEIAMEIYLDDTLYGTLYKNEEGYYPSLYIPYGDRPATFRMRGVQSGTHYRPVTVPQGTEACEVVFCEKYPDCPAIGRRYPQQEPVDLHRSETTVRLMDTIIRGLQPDGEIYEMMLRPEVRYTRPAVFDGGVQFHHITDTQAPVYFPGRWVQEFTFHSFSQQSENGYIALNDSDCIILLKHLEHTLTHCQALQHLQFFTEDGCLCLMVQPHGKEQQQ